MKAVKRTLSLLLVLTVLLSMKLTVLAAHPFEDVAADSWYSGAVDYVYDNRLMNGTSSVTFGPDVNMTRAMLVTVLYRIEGEPSVDVALPFTDVAADSWFRASVAWAYSKGVVNGTSATTFSPDANITREQMVVIFSRYANTKGVDTPAVGGIDGYADAPTVSAYARSALSWAVGSGIINGTSATTLSPAAGATRAQCAVILNRFIEWMNSGAAPDVTPSPTVKPTPTPTATPSPGHNQTPFG